MKRKSRMKRKEETMNKELKHLKKVYITVVILFALSMITGGAVLL